MWANYHTHSNFCDGKGDLLEYAKRASEFHMHSIGFSSHAPLPFSCAWCMKSHDLAEYMAEINEIKATYKGLQIYAGLEVDYIPGQLSPKDFEPTLDYTIGSIHFVDALPDGTPWEVDGTHNIFHEGLEQIFHGNIRHAVSRYFELTREMIMHGTPAIVGHLDKIKIHNPNNALFREDDKWYREEIEKTLKLIVEAGLFVEVNSRGIYQKKSKETYPGNWILQLLQHYHIPVTLSSDAHHPDDLISLFPSIAKILLRSGIKQIQILHDGNWTGVSFDSDGIKAP